MPLMQKMFHLFLLLSISSLITAEEKVKKGPDLSSSNLQGKFSKDDIILGKEQREAADKPNGNTAPISGKEQDSKNQPKNETIKINATTGSFVSEGQTSGVKGDLGSANLETSKPDYYDYADGNNHFGENYVIFAPGEDGDDEEYEEPYAMYRKRRDLSQERSNGINLRKNADFSGRYPRRSVRAKRSAADLFRETEDISDNNQNKLPEFYQYVENKNSKSPYDRILKEEILPQIAKEIYPELFGDEVPETLDGINEDDIYRIRYGSTLPVWNKESQHQDIQYYDDGSPNWEVLGQSEPDILDLEKDDAERLAMLLQSVSEKEHQNK